MKRTAIVLAAPSASAPGGSCPSRHPVGGRYHPRLSGQPSGRPSADRCRGRADLYDQGNGPDVEPDRSPWSGWSSGATRDHQDQQGRMVSLGTRS